MTFLVPSKQAGEGEALAASLEDPLDVFVREGACPERKVVHVAGQRARIGARAVLPDVERQPALHEDVRRRRAEPVEAAVTITSRSSSLNVGRPLIAASAPAMYVSLVNPEFTSFRKLTCPSFAEGLALVPKSITKRETPVFISVRALGGNMKGWRKDPANNPPRLRLEFYAFDGASFTDITE